MSLEKRSETILEKLSFVPVPGTGAPGAGQASPMDPMAAQGQSVPGMMSPEGGMSQPGMQPQPGMPPQPGQAPSGPEKFSTSKDELYERLIMLQQENARLRQEIQSMGGNPDDIPQESAAQQQQAPAEAMPPAGAMQPPAGAMQPPAGAMQPPAGTMQPPAGAMQYPPQSGLMPQASLKEIVEKKLEKSSAITRPLLKGLGLLGIGGAGAGYLAGGGLAKERRAAHPLHAQDELYRAVGGDVGANAPYRITARGQIVRRGTGQAVRPSEAAKYYF